MGFGFEDLGFGFRVHGPGFTYNTVGQAQHSTSIKNNRDPLNGGDRRRDGWGRGTARAEDAHGTPTQSHVSPSLLVYEVISGFDKL